MQDRYTEWQAKLGRLVVVTRSAQLLVVFAAREIYDRVGNADHVKQVGCGCVDVGKLTSSHGWVRRVRCQHQA